MIDGIVNVTNNAIETVENDSFYCLRVTVKEGLSFFDATPIDHGIIGINFGLVAETEKTLKKAPCGEKVAIFFRHNKGLTRTAINLSAFLSQVKILHDPLPTHISAPSYSTIKIDSEDFEAPKGIFDCPVIDLVFEGSTFKVAPKIFTDQVMKELSTYPVGSDLTVTAPWAPFKGCKNIQRITKQGTFSDNINLLAPCDLTYYDDDGFGKLDAYPDGGKPRIIDRYVQAKKIHLGTRFPVFSAERLEAAFRPFLIDEVHIDTLGSVQLPFGGIDYTKAPPMKALCLYQPKFIVNLPLQQQQNFTFTWGSLGIGAPNQCEMVDGLYNIYQNIAEPEQDNHLATPQYLQANLLYSWGKALGEALSHIELTESLMPKTSIGMRVVKGYYRKVILGNEKGKYNNQFPLMQRLKKNGADHTINITPLPDGVQLLTGYADSLYQHQVITSDINVPAIPSTVKGLTNCYRYTFAQTTNEPLPITPSLEEPKIFLIYGVHDGYTLKELKAVSNVTESTNCELRELIDSNNGTLQATIRQTPTLGFEHFNSWSDLIAKVKDGVKTPTMFDLLIRHKITLNSSPMPYLELNRKWQYGTFFYSAADPTLIDMFLPVNAPKSDYNWYKNMDVFKGVFYDQQIKTVFGTVKRQESGLVVQPNPKHATFLMYVTYNPQTDAQMIARKYDIENVKYGAGPFTENDNHPKPFQYFASPYAFRPVQISGQIKSPLKRFLAKHNINLRADTLVTFSAGINPPDPRGILLPFGINYKIIKADNNVPLYEFYGSWMNRPPSRFEPNEQTTTVEGDMFNQKPLYIDSEVMELPEKHYAGSLNNIYNQINKHLTDNMSD